MKENKKNRKKTDRLDKRILLAFSIILVAFFVKMLGLGTVLSDALIAVGALVHIVSSIIDSKGEFKPLSFVSNLLIALVLVTVVASFLGMPVRYKITASMVIAALCVLFALYIYIFRDSVLKKEYVNSGFDVITSVFLGVMVGFLGTLSVTELTDSDIGEYALVVLIVSLIITVAIRVYASVRRYKTEGTVSKFWGQVGWFFLILLLVFATIIFSIMALNYSLDDSEPIDEYSYEIIDKRTKSRRKGGMHFYLTVDRDGKEDEISVTSERYYSSDIGDKLTVYGYEGAFGFEYYEYK